MSVTQILINLAGGVALLLWGVRMVRTGMTRSFGAHLRRAVARYTRNRLQAFLVGLGVTALLQSSTATILIAGSFAARHLLAASAALAIALGADLGSSLVTQILSLRIQWLSPLLITVGVAMFMGSNAGRWRNFSRVLLGLGLVLLSLGLIGEAAAPLRGSERLSLLLAPLTEEPLLALLAGALLTWLLHSSLAMVLLLASLVASETLSLELALMLVLGANIGSGIVAGFLSRPMGVGARRVALGNLSMRTIGAVTLLWLLPAITPSLGMLGGSGAQQVIELHIGFNLLLVVAFLPFVGAVSSLTARILPEAPGEEGELRVRYLDDNALDSPPAALAAAARETLRMGEEVERMLAKTIDVLSANDPALIRELEQADDKIDLLHEAIKLYVTRLSREELDRRESERVVDILTFTTNLEHIGDIIDKNLMELAAKKARQRLSFSAEGLADIKELHGRVLLNMRQALNLFMSGDVRLARELLEEKTVIRDLEREMTARHFERVTARQTESVETSSLHLDVLRDLKRIHGHITSIAYPILERAGELRDTRLRSVSAADMNEADAPPDEASAPVRH